MIKHFTLFLCCSFLAPFSTFSQQYYMASGGESIFSVGVVDAGATEIKPVLRWSPVFNFQQQVHFDFSGSFGMYSGLGLRNVGLISKINYDYTNDSGNAIEKTVTVKERSYSLGLPLMFKLGAIDDGAYFAAGAEAELMFAYKRKIDDGETKYKSDSWFDDRVNIFNPSVIAEIHFPEGLYVRFKYYLLDFLNYESITLIDGTVIQDYGVKSPLFYVSLGTVKFKKKIDTKYSETESASAFFRSE